ncbi:MAG TPA: cell envelope integrity protein TolA [Reyranella sp.]|nr:cell envelope integrity protein TolA [Reyranella sp.]
MARRVASVEMRTPAILSAGVHVVALVAAIVNFNFFRSPPLEPEPVMLDFVAIDKKAAAPTVGNPPPQPKDAKIAEETTKAPPPKTLDPPPAPEPPKPEVAEFKPVAPAPVEKPKPEPPKPTEDVIALKPKQPEPPKEEKKPEPPKPEPPKPPEVKKQEPPKPPPPKPEPKKPNVDALVDSILKNQESKPKQQTPEQQPKPVQEITRVAPAAPNLAAVVTASEVEGVRSKIRPCWLSPGGAREAPVVTLTVQMNQDGTPVKAEVRDTGRYGRDPVFRAAADAAHRAVMNPRCQPWPLPADRYNGWRTITFNFDPRDY